MPCSGNGKHVRFYGEGFALAVLPDEAGEYKANTQLAITAPELLEAADFAMRFCLLAAEPVAKGDPYMRIPAEKVYEALEKLRKATDKAERRP